MISWTETQHQESIDIYVSIVSTYLKNIWVEVKQLFMSREVHSLLAMELLNVRGFIIYSLSSSSSYMRNNT